MNQFNDCLLVGGPPLPLVVPQLTRGGTTKVRRVLTFASLQQFPDCEDLKTASIRRMTRKASACLSASTASEVGGLEVFQGPLPTTVAFPLAARSKLSSVLVFLGLPAARTIFSMILCRLHRFRGARQHAVGETPSLSAKEPMLGPCPGVVAWNFKATSSQLEFLCRLRRVNGFQERL